MNSSADAAHASECSQAVLLALQNELGRFVVEEHAIQRETMHQRWASDLEDRLLEGRCIPGLRVVEHPSPKRWVLVCEGNDSRFREGDFVRVSTGDPRFPLMEATLLTVGDNRVELQEWRTYGDTVVAIGLDGLCIDESFVDLEDRYRSAIEDLGKTNVGRDLILPLLRGALQPAVDAAEWNDTSDRATRDGLNDQQIVAVANAVASEACWLIQGPPGTGKTHVLAWVIQDLLQRGERIFVTSFTHRAINNLLAAVAERLEAPGRVAKIAPYLDPSLPVGVEQRERFDELSFANDTSGAGYVVGATPFALRSSRIGQRDFDTIVIDEASQVTLPLAVMAMLAGRKYIFAGDHQQLPPVTLSRPANEARSLSIFGRLVGRGYDTLLTTTHRLNDDLCRWPSDTFYKSRLRAHPRAGARALLLARRPAELPQVFAAAPAVVWLAVPHRGCRSYAPEETTLVADLLRAFHEGGLAWKDIGVVVPFRRQARFLRKRLASRTPDRRPPPGLVIDTVERMQGQEREVVIVSFTTSDEDFAHRLREFLFQPQRLNVAATRPRTKLVLVASPALVAYALARSDDDGAGCFISLLESAHRVDVPLPDADGPDTDASRA
jgi:DNA replication ATP-dependent helicase Dna2